MRELLGYIAEGVAVIGIFCIGFMMHFLEEGPMPTTAEDAQVTRRSK